MSHPPNNQSTAPLPNLGAIPLAGLLEPLVEAIAARVTDLLTRTGATAVPPRSPWLDFEAARAYLGFTRDQLYKLAAAQAIPVRKKTGGQGLRFHQAELDSWMETEYPRLDRLP